MDEEFFFPQNVRTTYRLWLLGPRHLKRLALAPVLALLLGWATYRISLLLAIALAAFAAAVYTAVFCLPLLGDDQTLSDIGLEIYRHRRHQNHFAHRKEEPDGCLAPEQ
jgi:hypothetical protein